MTNTAKQLEAIGLKIKIANAKRTNVIAAAKEAAVAAAAEGMSEVEIARALGVDRARTLRRWLGK